MSRLSARWSPTACTRFSFSTATGARWGGRRRAACWADRDTGLLSARDAVTEAALTLEPSASVRDALELMRREDVPRVLVAHAIGQMPEGVVAEHDLLAVLAR